MYWTENEAMVSSDANYSFIVSSDRILVAHFALLFTITTTIEPDEGGIVTGAGVFNSGTTCTITAIPSEGYLFLNWSKDEEVVSCNTSYSFTVTEDAEIKAIFMLLEDTLIGEGEVANMYLPSCSSNSYSLSQQIYTPDEIGASGSITSVSYFNAGETTIRNYDIYMVHTDKSTFDSITDWITVTEANHVFSGSVTLSKGYWSSIVLDIPFEYDGTSNLALIVDDNTGSWANGMDCRVYNTEVNQAIHICSDSTNYSPMEPPTTFGSSEYPIMESVKSQIMLNIEPLKTAQTYALTTGWNWWSTNLDITLEDLQGALMEALPDTSIIIKGKNNTTTYNPNTRRWSGTLLWDVTQMYRILVNNACEITLRGTPVNPDEHPITIVNGANWIAFTLGESMTLTDAFAGFGVDGDIIKSQSHTTQYKSGRWMGKQLTRFEPGKGYLYKSNASESRTFTFPISTK